MLTVSSGLFSRTISRQRIMEVTQTAHRSIEAAPGAAPAADPRYMGPIDWLTDHVFCNGIKTNVLARFHEIGRKTALLKMELQKNVDERNAAMIETCQREIQAARGQLNRVISGKTVAIEYERLAEPASSGFLVIRNRSNRLPCGIALCTPSADNPPGPAIAVPEDLFNCDSPESIQVADLPRILTAGKFRCAGEHVTVRLIKDHEPIVISSNRAAAHDEALQKKLTSLWFLNAVHAQLERLDATGTCDSTLQLNPPAPQVGTDEEEPNETQLAALEWGRFAKFIQTQFSQAMTRMQQHINNPYLAVLPELSRLALIQNPGIPERRGLKKCHARVSELVLKLATLNRNMLRLKSELNNLSQLLSFCTEPQMSAIFRQRMINFQSFISQFSSSAMGQHEVSALNAILDKQQVFLRDFGPNEIAQCYSLIAPPDTPTTLKDGIIPPVARVYQKTLISLLTNPAKPLSEVLQMMENMVKRNQVLYQIKVSQKGLADKIEANMRLCVFSETGELYQSGLDPDFGKSFYTPATYARIVTLLKLRKDLQNPAKTYTKQSLQNMRVEILQHLRHIITEDEQILDCEHDDFSLSSTELHAPKTTDDGTPVSHENWARHMRSEAFQAKIGLIRKNLALARAANRAAIEKLTRRGEILDSLLQKSGTVSERAGTFRKEMKKLRNSDE